LHFHEATLQNALNALGGLLILTFKLYARRLAASGDGTLPDKKTTEILLPDSALLRLPDSFYYSGVVA
jgi:hypothetical protein